MQLWSISDLHIHDEQDPLYKDLLSFLERNIQSNDLLILGGDVFELMVGAPKFFKTRYAEFISLLNKKGRAGTRILFIEGNHDFHLKKAFSGIPNLELYTDDVALEWGGKKFYIAHGDLVDQKDRGYRLLRKIFRSPVIKGIALALPGEAVDRVGKKASELSQKIRGQTQRTISADQIPRTRNVFRSFAAEKIKEGFDFVLLGHCHDLDEMTFVVSEREGHYMNMGYPRAHRSCVTWTPGEQKLFRTPF